MIHVTKTYLPDFDTYTATLKRAWDKGWITNNGGLLLELEQQLRDHLQIAHLWVTANGTLPLQMALKALNITGEVITTPFSYVATTHAILWENCQPVFADIDPQTLCIDPAKIELAITDRTQAILATHVYGIPCDLEAIDAIARRHQLKVIYDAAHAFGCRYQGRSLLSYGDISTCSFHATKIFHTVEGGCVVAADAAVHEQLMYYRQFGHLYDDYHSMGINAKNSEMHAAMGLCVLPEVENIIRNRQAISEQYDRLLAPEIGRPVRPAGLEYNYAYYPVIFSSEAVLLEVQAALEKEQVYGRRYFYPSLNRLPFVAGASCPQSEDISSRVLCLPLYYGLPPEDVDRICKPINEIIYADCRRQGLCQGVTGDM